MKKLFFAAIAATALCAACENAGKSEVSLKSEADTLSYALGLANSQTGDDVKSELQMNGLDSTDIKAYNKGIEAAIKSSDSDLAYQLGYLRGLQLKFNNIKAQKGALGEKKFSKGLFLHGLHDGAHNTSALVLDPAMPELSNEPDTIGRDRAAMYAAQYQKTLAVKNNDFINKVKAEGAEQIPGTNVYMRVTKTGKGPAPKLESIAVVSAEIVLADNGKVVESMPAQQAPLAQLPGGKALPKGSVIEIYLPWSEAAGDQGMTDPRTGEMVIPPYANIIQRLTIIEINDQIAAPEPALGE